METFGNKLMDKAGMAQPQQVQILGGDIGCIISAALFLVAGVRRCWWVLRADEEDHRSWLNQLCSALCQCWCQCCHHYQPQHFWFNIMTSLVFLSQQPTGWQGSWLITDTVTVQSLRQPIKGYPWILREFCEPRLWADRKMYKDWENTFITCKCHKLHF